jgi:phosphotransferase system  glucose/maltose/N-acetylglucosamine-specific IIC component
MNRNRTQDRLHGAASAIAAVLSILIAIGILTGVARLFQSRGAPVAQLAAVERA